MTMPDLGPERPTTSDTRHMMERGRTASNDPEISNRAFGIALMVIVLAIVAILLALKL